MSSPSVVEALIAIHPLMKAVYFCSLIVLSIAIYRITLHPLSKFPGPTAWSISRFPWHWSLHHGRLHLDLQRLHQEYGPVVRTAPNELSYLHRDAFRDIHTTRPGHKLIPRNNVWFQRPKAQMEEASGIMEYNEANHARLRRGFASAFTESGIKEMSPVVVKHIDLMILQLTKVLQRQTTTQNGKVEIDLVEWLNFTTFDISGDLSFGEGFGSIEAEKAHPWVEINFHFGKGVAMLCSLNFLRPLNTLFAFVVPEKVKKSFIYHKELTQTRVGERLTNNPGRADFIGAVEEYNKECDAKGQLDRKISRAELDLNMSVLIFAGSETTGSGLSSIFRYLLQTPAAMDKLKNEVRTAFKHPSDITYASIAELAYLDAVIQEGLRLGPPTAISVPRMMPPGGEAICGDHVPEGTFVSPATYATFRSPEFFSNPEDFVPERWLPDSKIENDDLTVFYPFSLGRHMCIGWRLAWLTMRLILIKMLYTFDMELVSAMGDFGKQQTFIVWEKEPLRVALTRRPMVDG